MYASDVVSKLPLKDRVGFNIEGSSASDAIERIVEAEDAGLRQVWMSAGGARAADPLSVLAAASMRTTRIRLGTSIVPVYPRHPLVTAQQALAVEDLAPGRLRLGLGTSHKHIIEDTYGLQLSSPLEYIKEYVSLVRSVLWEGRVDNHHGKFFNLSGYTAPRKAKAPILVAALGVRSFQNAGQIADGAISWMCPIEYILGKAVQAVRAGALSQKRPAPPIVAHALVALSKDEGSVYSAAAKKVGFYSRAPFYAKMFAAAGFPISSDGAGTDNLARELVIWGSEESIRDRIKELLSRGVDELLLNLVTVSDEKSERKRLLGLVSSL